MKKRLLLFTIAVLLFAACKKDELQTAPIDGVIPATIAVTANIADTATVPSGLPKRLGFGTDGDPDRSSEFIQEGDYEYQYLAGDIFSNGWRTWNYPDGEFGRKILNQATKAGKIPVFSYYNIVPAKNRYEDPGFTNLNDAQVMNKYFDDFKFLLQLCKAYGKTVIVHYEPDLFGYFQMFKNDPSKGTVKVSASNNAEVKGFTNDAKGLAKAIVSLRDKYAPNVLLAWHASPWATAHDLIRDKMDPEQTAAATAAYYKSLDANFDLIFSEFSDRDSGYDLLVKGIINSSWTTQAASGTTMSDFDRFQRFLKALHLRTGKKIMLWQIPMGNSITKTCNNTLGHYQDNRAEYFLQPVLQSGNQDRLTQYTQAGVIAFLFGKGNNDCTSFMDARRDGVTAANETADDDGGFLRKSIKAYYQHGAISLR